METPLEKLKRMTAWDADPALTEDELDELLSGAALADAAGLAPLNEEWTPTYDINSAAARAWLVKAGRSATTVEVNPPDSGIVTSKVFDNCRAMARLHASKRTTSVSIR